MRVMGIKPKTAIISVHDKTGIVDFAKFLSENHIEILTTGGTGKLLSENKINVTEVSKYTGAHEILDGRVKTLNPKIFGGILALRDNKKHMLELEKQEIKLIDMVVVNLYPFEKTVAGEHSFEDALENIDIGGVSLIRAAAKNHENVAIITEPSDYDKIMREMKLEGEISQETLKHLAVKAIRKTASYDSAIDKYLSKAILGEETLRPYFVKGEEMRYGENPYQKAWFYKEETIEAIKNGEIKDSCVSNGKVLHGKQLSFNNILDANEAFELVKEFEEPCCAVIKHTNPCGVAIDAEISEAYRKALAADPLSAFGCVVALNRNCDLKTAELMKPNFIEVIICPKFDKGAFELLAQKKNIRLIETGNVKKTNSGFDFKTVTGGLLVQSRDFPGMKASELKVVTESQPSQEELDDMMFSVKVAKHVKSNCVVFVKDKVTAGIGAGQMSRVDSVKIATEKGGDRIKGSVMCSDAFFPFRDGIDEAAKAGVSAIIQPGGSIRDQEVIDAANEHKISMVFSGVRLFKH